MPVLDKVPDNSSGLFVTFSLPLTGYTYTIGLLTETTIVESTPTTLPTPQCCLEVIPTVVLSVVLSDNPNCSNPESDVSSIELHNPSFIDEITDALENGIIPQPCSEGVCGTYFLLNASGDRCGVFKPTDEEPGAVNYTKDESDSARRIGIKPGEAAIREVAAYMLDNGFASVPQTQLIEFNEANKFFNSKTDYKIGSVQKFVDHDCSSEDVGSSLFSVEDVQKIAVMDVRLINLDRHAGNILVKDKKLIPIDHGFCLPECFEDPLWFEWMNWSQSKQSILPEIKRYIESLDDDADCLVLKSYGFSVSARRSLRVGTYLLKAAVKKNLSLEKIASLLCTYGVNETSKVHELFKTHTSDLANDDDDQLPQSIISGLDSMVDLL